ncbi:hypothetical protein ACRALDRAFT_208072 [Sodiomyces alcalophilus JCM 7366]|uniref:uncharacterized protein n=1 Tax=Sodiomyces alcalophilus JCM 7366 TaxID=591952 RepID=UPI0039B52987
MTGVRGKLGHGQATRPGEVGPWVLGRRDLGVSWACADNKLGKVVGIGRIRPGRWLLGSGCGMKLKTRAFPTYEFGQDWRTKLTIANSPRQRNEKPVNSARLEPKAKCKEASESSRFRHGNGPRHDVTGLQHPPFHRGMLLRLLGSHQQLLIPVVMVLVLAYSLAVSWAGRNHTSQRTELDEKVKVTNGASCRLLRKKEEWKNMRMSDHTCTVLQVNNQETQYLVPKYEYSPSTDTASIVSRHGRSQC